MRIIIDVSFEGPLKRVSKENILRALEESISNTEKEIPFKLKNGNKGMVYTTKETITIGKLW